MTGGLWRKWAAVYELLRYGPTRLQALEERLEALHAGTLAAPQALGNLLGDLQREAGWLRDHLAALETAAGRGEASRALAAGTADTADTRLAAPFAARTAAEAAFYPALEQHFRGTHQEITDRLSVYREWIDSAPPGLVADLGCGRGEWLDLLARWGRDAVGIDSNAVLAAQCRARGLALVEDDAVRWLSAQAPDSLAAVTGFHIAEHLPLRDLLALVAQARRALLPGGLLVLETPNPENLVVATQSFWVDPTHQRPIPPLLLEFIATHGGLQVLDCPRLNPPDEVLLGRIGTADPGLRQMLAQGRDYAVIARKPRAGA